MDNPRERRSIREAAQRRDLRWYSRSAHPRLWEYSIAAPLGAHPLEPLATVCLSANSLLYCLSAWGVWAYAAARRQLLAEGADRRALQRVARIMLLVAVSLAIAVPLAFLSVYLAYAVWILCVPIAAWLGGRRRESRR